MDLAVLNAIDAIQLQHNSSVQGFDEKKYRAPHTRVLAGRSFLFWSGIVRMLLHRNVACLSVQVD